jgi:hypothetical protein
MIVKALNNLLSGRGSLKDIFNPITGSIEIRGIIKNIIICNPSETICDTEKNRNKFIEI